jgi:hypothetical protein
LIFSQSNYPLQTVINGDSVVILRKGQADTINDIFESQKQKIADARQLIEYKDSLLRRKDSLLRITNITVVEVDGGYKYFYGQGSLEFCKKLVAEAKLKGYKSAFIVAPN